jgi:hypothetical protein
MNNPMHEWLFLGLSFAGAPALALVGRWEEVEAGETLPRACGPARPAPPPADAPEPVPPPEPAWQPARAYLRLGRGDEGMDADRRRRRYEGMVRASY